MNDLPVEVNKELKPNTADRLGYELVGDVKLPLDEEILYLINYGFSLGWPTSSLEAPEFLGLYRPNNSRAN